VSLCGVRSADGVGEVGRRSGRSTSVTVRWSSRDSVGLDQLWIPSSVSFISISVPLCLQQSVRAATQGCVVCRCHLWPRVRPPHTKPSHAWRATSHTWKHAVRLRSHRGMPPSTPAILRRAKACHSPPRHPVWASARSAEDTRVCDERPAHRGRLGGRDASARHTRAQRAACVAEGGGLKRAQG